MGGTGSQMQSRRGDFQTEHFQRWRSPIGTQSDLWCTLCLRSQLSRGILSYCKGYCGWVGRRAGCGAEHSTSRGSKEERIRIHVQVWANIQSHGYKE